MPIPVSCGKCGKQLKVKDALAGKAIRCPGCKNVLRVPDAASGKAPAKGKSSTPKIDEQDALQRYEEAQKRKNESEEAKAAYREEQKKIIDSYDQLAGRSKKKGKDEKGKDGGKPALAGEKPRKVTIFTKMRDAIAAVFSSLIAKYIILVLLLCAGVIGSVKLVQFVTGYMNEEVAAMSDETREKLDELYRETKVAIRNRQWSKARDKLEEILNVEPLQEKNEDYQRLKKQVEREFNNPTPGGNTTDQATPARGTRR